MNLSVLASTSNRTVDPKVVALDSIEIPSAAGGWLVGCFGFSGPLRQYFSLYRAVSQREGERRKDRRE